MTTSTVDEIYARYLALPTEQRLELALRIELETEALQMPPSEELIDPATRRQIVKEARESIEREGTVPFEEAAAELRARLRERLAARGK